MRDAGEPMSRGQLDRRAADARASRGALFWVALCTGAILVNGILAILFVALMQALGAWVPVMAETPFVSPEGPEALTTGLPSLPNQRPAATP